MEKFKSNKVVYCRKCSECQKGMNEGYCIDGGVNYYCDDDCLHKNYTPGQWAEEIIENSNYSYWTQCDVETDAEYKLINGILTEIE